MSSRTRPRLWSYLLIGLALMFASTPAALAEDGTAVTASATAESSYEYRFLSSPDFLNADIGDVRESRFYRKGDPNSTNRQYEKALDTVLDAFAAEYEPGAPRDIFVAGDLVNGHWGMDTANTGIFGPTKTYRQKVEAVKRAGKLYYGQWMDRFHERNITPYAAVGDHEIGDDPWGRPGGGMPTSFNKFKQRSFPVWKQTFSKHILRDSKGRFISPERPRGLAHDTAYAVRPHPELLLVSLDVFKRARGTVLAELDRAQLKWLRSVLQRANRDGVDWTIVQGHTPILGPVRQKGSSGLMYRRGAKSALWKLLRAQDVDLYFAGEVHDITAHQPRKGDPVQISHGGLFAYGGTNYMVADVTGESMSIVMRSFRSDGPKRINEGRMWQTDNARLAFSPVGLQRSAPGWVFYKPGPYVSGRMTLTPDGVILSRSGNLGSYRGKP